METVKQYLEKLKSIQGKTIAIVYIHEDDQAKGYKHYNIWGSDVIASWVNGIGELNCKPYILDLRTFIFKAMNNTLPCIDFVVNLNNGNVDINTLTLLPSTCAFLGIPCIPTNSLTTVIAEHKLVANLIAYQSEINVPKEFSSSTIKGIIRPYTLGSSIGVKRQDKKLDIPEELIHQEFIEGIEMTTPILYNPMTRQLEVLPSFIYYPEKYSNDWYFDDYFKSSRNCKSKIVQLSAKLESAFLKLANNFFITSYCRIDTRIKCDSEDTFIENLSSKIDINDTYFVEINSMPTINNSKITQFSLQHLTNENKIKVCYDTYSSYTGKKSIAGFILSCSILSILEPSKKDNWIE